MAIILLKFDPFGLLIRATNTFRESAGPIRLPDCATRDGLTLGSMLTIHAPRFVAHVWLTPR